MSTRAARFLVRLAFAVTALAPAVLGSSAAAAPLPTPWPDDVRARLPERGLLIASLSQRADGESVFVVSELRRDGLIEVHREAPSSVFTFGWADERTLWALAREGEILEETGVVLTKIVDGRVSATYRVSHSSWFGPPREAWTDLYLGARGEVALVRCRIMDSEAIPEVCRASTYRVLEGDELIHRLKLPRGARDVDEVRWQGRLPPAVAPPRGWRFTQAKVDGVAAVRCKGPGGGGVWPGEDVADRELQVQPKKIMWLSQDPPLVAVTGPRSTPVETLAGRVQVLRGCPPVALRGYAWLAPDVWAELTPGEPSPIWRIHVGALHVADLAGVDGGLAPAPRR